LDGSASEVIALALHEDRLIVGGSFERAGGQPANGIAAWDGSAWSALAEWPIPGRARVTALAVFNGQLVAAWTRWNGSTYTSQVARLESMWQPIGTVTYSGLGGYQPSVSVLRVFEGQLLAAGWFSSIGGASVRNLAAWDGTQWQAFSTDTTLDWAHIESLVVHQDSLIVGSWYDCSPPDGDQFVPCPFVARWQDGSWQPLSNQDAFPSGELLVHEGQLLSLGYFGPGEGRVARWDGLAWSPLAKGSHAAHPDLVHALGVYDGNLMLLGHGPAFAQWAGSGWRPLGEGFFGGYGPSAGGSNTFMDGVVYAFANFRGDTIAAGSFTLLADGSTTRNLARWDGQAWQPVHPGLEGRVNAAIVHAGELVIGGTPEHIADPICTLLKWNGAQWTSILPPPGLTCMRTRALAALPNGGLIVGGNFSTTPGLSNIARWHGGVWSSLAGGVDGFVEALAVLPGGELIAGGFFQNAGGVPCAGLALWTGTAWQPFGDLAGTPVPHISALLVLPSGDLIAAGSFTSIGGVAANHVARWRSGQWSPLGSGMPQAPSALAVLPDGTIVAGGPFSVATGAPFNGLALWNGQAWSALGTGVAGTVQYYVPVGVYALHTDAHGSLHVGGQFNTADGVPAAGIARWGCAPAPPCSADYDNDGDPATDADIEAFFRCAFAGDCCTWCGSADFDGDGDTATDADIEAFFRVLAGAAC
jgi:hypothetical protein